MSSFFPPVKASHAREFQIVLPGGLPKLGNFKYFPIPLISPKTLENTMIYSVFSIFPCSNATGQLKHRCKKSFQHIVFHSVFKMFPIQKNHMFFALKSVQNTSFQFSDIQKPFNASLFTMFFRFWLFFHSRKPVKMTQNSIKTLRV